MAHPVLWRGKTFFYPIGNTPAVCLTQDLCPTEKADILLLGCGDPRHIFYTVYTNNTGLQVASRQLDFTCCDLESAVIARNVILFTLLADEGAVQKVPQIWNIFFHFYLDKASHDLLISQCRKLVELSSNLDGWNNGPYGHFLRMCTGDTLVELRRLWQLYVKTTTCSPSEAKAFRSAYAADIKTSKAKFEFVCTSSRAAGPLSMYAFKMAGDHYNIYWETGVCSAVPKRSSEVSYPNPTLAYSMVGDKFGVHYGTDPLSCFHLAEAFAPAIGSTCHPEQVTLKDVISVCKTQFSRWCSSVSKVLRNQGPSSLSPLIIRCFVGDALSLCQALDYSRTAKSTSTPFPVAPWNSARIKFDSEAYGTGTQSPAPTTFNVIDTSNLLDHVGVLNILVVTSPILQRTPSATLYTEGLSGSSSEDTLPQQLCGDIATIGLLLGLIPVSFVSQFTNRSNMHELLMQATDKNAAQNHERLAWKLLGCAEKLLTDLDFTIDITPEQLASVFFNIYLNMFSHENAVKKLAMAKRSIIHSGIVHYHRRSFVEILGAVKRRVITDWDSTMRMLHDKIQNDKTLMTGMNFYQDLCCHLHLLGIFTVEWMSPHKVREVYGNRFEWPLVFRNWKTLPQTVCVVLIVPRARLQSLLPALDEAGTPVLQCDIRGVMTWNAFACINTVFGTVKISGKGDSKTAVIEEDATRRYGTSPLVVWFWVPSFVFSTDHRLSVVLSVLPTPACMSLAMTLGLDLSLFRADMGDERFVHILRQRPNAVPESPEEKNMQVSGHSMKTPGQATTTFVTLDKECKQPLSFTTRVDIVEPEMKASMTSGATPTVNQVSMHSIAIVLGDRSLYFPFPLPINAKNAKLRIARKSLYIEVTLPLKLALGETDADIFPVIPKGGDLALWNMHRVNLDQCMPFSIANKAALVWVNPHMSCMLSERERCIPQSLTTGSTLLDVKYTLHSMFRHASGTGVGKPPLCYAMQEDRKIFVMLYITNLRLDVGSHTIVADAWVMPSSPSSEKFEAFSKVSSHLRVNDMKMVGMGVEERKAWVHLIVAATERCRTWKHKTNCEYRVQDAIPLTLDPEESPICSCGAGVGAEAFVKKYPMLRPLAPYVTRAAISPLFALSYMERVGSPKDAVATGTPSMPASAAAVCHVCAACGKEGSGSGSLLICSRCKVVRYCSADCQRDDWKGHKKRCVVPSS